MKKRAPVHGRVGFGDEQLRERHLKPPWATASERKQLRWLGSNINPAGGDHGPVNGSLTPSPALSPGRHSFTVVVLTVDGRVAGRSATYTV